MGEELDLAHAAASVVAVRALPRRAELLARDPLGDVLEVAVGHERDLAPRARRGAARRRRARAAPRAASCARPPRLPAAASESLRHVGQMRRVEVDADPFDGKIGRALLEQRARVAEGEPDRELRSAREALERLGEVSEARRVLAREERLGQDDELGIKRVDRRLEHAFGHRLRRHPRASGEREGRGQRDEPRPRQGRDVALVERRAQLWRRSRRLRRAVEAVRVEETGERSGLQAVREVEQRPEMVLPAQHPVGEEIEPGVLLAGDEGGAVALDLLVHGLLRRPPAVEVARRLDELLGARVDPGDERLQLSHGPPPPTGSPRAGRAARAASGRHRTRRGRAARARRAPPRAARGRGHRRSRRPSTASSTSASARSCSTLKKPGPVANSSTSWRGPVAIDPRRAGLQHRHQGRMPREHADLARVAGHDQHLDLTLECRPVGRHEGERERLPSATRRELPRPRRGVRFGLRRGLGSASPSSPRPFATASSIVPTM